eukprot:SAG31_NODE_616_length_13519_cov_2.372876_11_plen_162_part_00
MAEVEQPGEFPAALTAAMRRDAVGALRRIWAARLIDLVDHGLQAGPLTSRIASALRVASPSVHTVKCAKGGAQNKGCHNCAGARHHVFGEGEGGGGRKVTVVVVVGAVDLDLARPGLWCPLPPGRRRRRGTIDARGGLSPRIALLYSVHVFPRRVVSSHLL